MKLIAILNEDNSKSVGWLKRRILVLNTELDIAYDRAEYLFRDAKCVPKGGTLIGGVHYTVFNFPTLFRWHGLWNRDENSAFVPRELYDPGVPRFLAACSKIRMLENQLITIERTLNQKQTHQPSARKLTNKLLKQLK